MGVKERRFAKYFQKKSSRIVLRIKLANEVLKVILSERSGSIPSSILMVKSSLWILDRSPGCAKAVYLEYSLILNTASTKYSAR